jgi:hypothetical protein
MAKIDRSCGWMTWTLLIALTACGDNITTSANLPVSVPSASDPASSASGAAAITPTLVLTTEQGWGDLNIPPGVSPPAGAGFSLILRGENFSPDWSGTAYIRGTFLDGSEMPLAWGSGRGADGSYLMLASYDCPSRLREAWAVVVSSDGKSLESKHIVPAC